MKMKFLIVVLALPAVLNAISPEEVKARADVSHKSCFESSKSNMDTVAKIRSHDIDENDDVIRKHIGCYSQEVGFVKSDGKINRELIKKRAGAQIEFNAANEEKFNKCTVPKTPEVSVDLFTTRVSICLYKNFPSLVLM